MSEPLIRLLDYVRIDDDRQYIEFGFRDGAGEAQTIQIDFEYIESLTALFQQAFVSAVIAARQGPNRRLGRDYVSVPRVDIDHPISVAVDVMQERVLTMFMLGTPFQASYSMPLEVALTLSTDLRTACDQTHQQSQPEGRLVN